MGVEPATEAEASKVVVPAVVDARREAVGPWSGMTATST